MLNTIGAWLQAVIRLVLRLIVVGSIFWTAFFSIVVSLGWYVANNTPNHGDNMGLGIICLSIPLAAICSVLILYAYQRLNRAPPTFQKEKRKRIEPEKPKHDEEDLLISL